MLPAHVWTYDEFYDRVESEVLKLASDDLTVMRQCMSKASVHEVFDQYMWEASGDGVEAGFEDGFYKPRNESEAMILAKAIYETGYLEVQKVADYDARLTQILSQLDRNDEVDSIMHQLVSMAKAERRDICNEMRSPFLNDANRPKVVQHGRRLSQLAGGGQLIRETQNRLKQLGLHPVDLRELEVAWHECGKHKDK